jgi:hypothetical protein
MSEQWRLISCGLMARPGVISGFGAGFPRNARGWISPPGRWLTRPEAFVHRQDVPFRELPGERRAAMPPGAGFQTRTILGILLAVFRTWMRNCADLMHCMILRSGIDGHLCPVKTSRELEATSISRNAGRCLADR